MPEHDGSPVASSRPCAPTAMRLECGPCAVREWARTDKAALLAIANDHRIARNLTHRYPHPYTAADADRWFELLERLPRRMHWAIEVDGQLAGGIGAEPGEGVDARSAHFGYWLGPVYWGRGIMTEACRATVEHVFDRSDLVRLEARVFAWNPASMRVLEKCGFEREGLLRRSVWKDAQVIDAVLYARVR